MHSHCPIYLPGGEAEVGGVEWTPVTPGFREPVPSFCLPSTSQFAFCCWDKHHDQKQLREEKIYFSLQVIAHYGGRGGQDLEVGTEVDVTEEHCQRT